MASSTENNNRTVRAYTDWCSTGTCQNAPSDFVTREGSLGSRGGLPARDPDGNLLQFVEQSAV